MRKPCAGSGRAIPRNLSSSGTSVTTATSVPPEEVVDHGEVPLRFFPERHMGTIFEDDELRTRDALVDLFAAGGRQLVVQTDGDQRGNPDLVEAVEAVPVAQVPVVAELAGPPHGDVDLHGELLERLHDLREPWLAAAEVHPVDRHDRVLILRGLSSSRLLMAAKRLAEFLREPFQQAIHLAAEERRVGDRRSEHEGAQMLLVGERVVGGEHPSPGMAVEVEPFEAEVGAESLELVDEAIRSPERRIVGPVRVAAAELVVDKDTAV